MKRIDNTLTISQFDRLERLELEVEMSETLEARIIGWDQRLSGPIVKRWSITEGGFTSAHHTVTRSGRLQKLKL